MPMPVTKVADIAYARLSAPDLDRQEEFLTHFGLVRAARTATALYMRGSDPAHHLHVTELGEPRFIGFAYRARRARRASSTSTNRAAASACG
jgi:hypothetical protein